MPQSADIPAFTPRECAMRSKTNESAPGDKMMINEARLNGSNWLKSSIPKV
jgi:hypothetical protein